MSGWFNKPINVPDKASDLTVDSSVKTFTVPSNEIWTVEAIYLAYTTNATAGTRQVRVEYLDSNSNVLIKKVSRVTQAASLTYLYNFVINFNDIASVVTTEDSANEIYHALPLMKLPPDSQIKIYDVAAIAASGSGENLLATINYFKFKWDR